MRNGAGVTIFGRGAKEIAAERRVKSLELRKGGMSYRQIGAQLGISEAQAHRDVTRILASIAKLAEPDALQVRILEQQRLDALLEALWPQAQRGNHGAIDRVLRIMERRARLLGLDAPTRTDITTGGDRLVIEYVNDWRGAPAIPASWADGNQTAGTASELAVIGPALAEDDSGNGRRR